MYFIIYLLDIKRRYHTRFEIQHSVELYLIANGNNYNLDNTHYLIKKTFTNTLHAATCMNAKQPH